MLRIFGKRHHASLSNLALPQGLALSSPTPAQVDNPDDPQKADDPERALAYAGRVTAPPPLGIPGDHVTQRSHPAERPPPRPAINRCEPTRPSRPTDICA